MEEQYTTLGYGFHLDETVLMIKSALKFSDLDTVRDYCLENWPQKSVKNKISKEKRGTFLTIVTSSTTRYRIKEDS